MTSTLISRGLRAVEARNIAVQMVTLGLAFPLSIMVSRVLGPEGRGIFALASMTAAVGALVGGAGLADAAPRVVARHAADGAEGVLVRALALGAGPAVILFALISPILLPRVGLRPTPVVIGLTSLLLLVMTGWPLWLNFAVMRGKTRLPIEAEAIRTLAYGALAVGAAGIGVLDARVALAAFAASYIVASAVVLRILRPVLAGPPPPVAKAIRREAFALGWQGAVARLLEYGATRLDAFLVGALLGPTAVGTYVVAVGVAELTLLAAMANVPAVTHRLATGRAGWGRFLTVRVGMASALASVGALGLILVGHWFVNLALGTRFEAAVAPLRILAIAAVALGVTRLLRHANFALGRMQANWLADLAGIGVLAPAAVLVVPRAGLTGAAFALLAAYLTSAAVMATGLSRYARRDGANVAA